MVGGGSSRKKMSTMSLINIFTFIKDTNTYVKNIKIILVFYNYYNKMRDLYKNTIDNFVNVDHQIINQTNNIETFFEI